MKKLNTLVIFGGASNEYEVSLRSVITILDNLDRDKFNPVLVGITKEGSWYLCEENKEAIKNNTWMKNAKKALLSPDRLDKGLFVLDGDTVKYSKIDCALLALHGQNCEDGSLQGLLKLAGIPFTGAGVSSSAVGFDKEFTHIIAERAFVPMAKWIKVDSSMNYEDILADVKFNLGFPAFIKPANSGSSVGTCPIMSEKDLKNALETAFKHDKKAIIEEHIKGHEVECAVMGNHDAKAYETGEIVSLTGFYDYDSKYKNDTAKLLMPANISLKLQERVKELAVKAYNALGCRGYARVDFFVTEYDEVIFNEINTLPGFTSISMWPQMMVRSGYDMKSLITKLLELAMEE